ncbi:ABC transporter permease [Sinomonas sp. ASV322]|uniref:ABC transporter permease n=1 Tax=Sinomonas sp. ASV322 TaxID=3041920 RepID=UPI0027DC695A|nr:ABC transporter permease [Sinomonas sp. ASV322]MDQ4501704.1 ABC transporter permease [Sinomonas sp. ASV322]
MQSSTLLGLGPGVVVAVVLLTALAAAVHRGALDGGWRPPVTASLRAVGQLAVVALLVSQLGKSPWLALLFTLAMFAVAVVTAGRRADRTRWWWAAAPIAAGVAPAVLILLATGVLPFDGLALIALIGQQVGGAMTTTSLAARRVLAELELRRGEVEAAVALGFEWRPARLLVARHTAREALIPSLDQTRTVGTVTLPGAFVGMVLGGASPVDAAIVQLVVLVSLVAVSAIAAAVALRLCASGRWAHRTA